MDWANFLIQLLVTTVAMAVCFGLGVAWGYRKAHGERIETMRKNAHQALNQAQAEVNILDAAASPRSRRARIKGTSRRATQAGPDE